LSRRKYAIFQPFGCRVLGRYRDFCQSDFFIGARASAGRAIEGDGHVAAELKRRVQGKRATPGAAGRTAGALRGRAREIAEARDRAEFERREAARCREAELAEKERRVRLAALKRRGTKVWQEIETEIARRNPSGYDRATSLLSDLQALAVEEGSQNDFDHRLESIRVRHGTKGRFIERLTKLAC
jgi:hypothetical protein